jgi:hypothetical protein
MTGTAAALPSRARRQEIRARLFQDASERYAAGADPRQDGYTDLEDWFETQVAEFRRLKMPVPERPGWMRTDDWTLEGLVALADQLGRKLEPDDVTPGLRRFATAWLRSKPSPIDFEYLAEMKARLVGGDKLTIPQAKGVLNCAVAEARRTPRKATPATPAAPAVELDAGIYFKDGTVYKVVRAVYGSRKMYAKRLVPVEGARGRFEYAPGAVRELTPADRMTIEQGREYGALYGMCANCGAVLTAEDSIEAGMGPICRAKFA